MRNRLGRFVNTRQPQSKVCESCGTRHFRSKIYPRIAWENKRFCSLLCFHKYSKGRPKNKKHGLSETRFYHIWENMQKRCKDRKSESYPLYGGRGIECRWESFEQFRDDMYHSYVAHVTAFGESYTSIDRLDNNSNYCKENCRWATPKEQSRNNRRTNLLTFDGKTMCLTDWATHLGIKPTTLSNRIHGSGWTPERALATPVI